MLLRVLGQLLPRKIFPNPKTNPNPNPNPEPNRDTIFLRENCRNTVTETLILIRCWIHLYRYVHKVYIDYIDLN